MFSTQFWLGVAASVVAMFIGFVVVQVRMRVVLRWSTLRLFWNIARRLSETGVSNFFADRSHYALYRRERTVSQYVATAQASLLYVGLWFAEGNEIDDIRSAVRQLTQRGCNVEFVLLDPQLEDHALARIAAYLGLSLASLRARLQAAWEDLSQLRNSLARECQPRFTLLHHGELLTASALLFDQGTPAAKILVDHKLYGVGREGSFGFELRPSRSPNSLYDRVAAAYLALRRAAYETRPSGD